MKRREYRGAGEPGNRGGDPVIRRAGKTVHRLTGCPALRFAARGAYLLLLSLSDDATIEVGSLGRLHFHPGNYIYVGSAMAGLEARVARHMRPEKKLHWHIDHLLARARIEGAVLFPSEKREECFLARTLHETPGIMAVARFGCTDCGCPSHLFFLGKRPFGRILRRLDRPPENGPDPFFRGSPA